MKPGLLLAILFASSAGPLWAVPAQTVGGTLRRAGGARPAGFGEAFVAIDGDIQGANYNPAGLSTVLKPEVTATYLRGFADDTTGSVGYVHSLRWGALYAGAIYYDAGQIEANLSNGIRETRTAQQDVVGMAGFSIGRHGPISLGVIGKGYKLELAEEAKASGVAVDAGLQWRARHWLNFGASVQNAGSDVQFEVEKESLPTTYRGGAAITADFLKIFPDSHLPYQLILVGDGVSVREEGGAFHGGIELRRWITTDYGVGYGGLRGGYMSDIDAFTVGVGGRLSAFSIDFMVYMYEDVDTAQRLTIGLMFGDPEGQKEEKTGRRRLDSRSR